MTDDNKEQTIAAVKLVPPSLLRQIVDAVDALDDQGKAEILKKIKLQKALQLAKIASEMLEGNTLDLTEEEIVTIVDDDRRKHFNLNKTRIPR